MIGSELVTTAFTVRIFCLRGQPALLSAKNSGTIYYDANQSKGMIKITYATGYRLQKLILLVQKRTRKNFRWKILN
jgi:hypothetical protein